MMTFRVLISFFVLMLMNSMSPAFAIGENVFVVPRVPVMAQAESATAAKNAAQTAGRRKAMDILLRRLTVEDDWVYLPRLATGEPSPAGISGLQLDNRGLEALESGFEVFNEKSSSSTYRAFITYRFKPAAMRRLLREAGIAYSEAQTRTALVLPVLQTKNNIYLWESNNPWMAAWRVRPYNNELTPMIAPLGDLEDQAAINARSALSLDEEGLQKMAERYSVSQVIVAHAFLSQVDGNDILRVKLINGVRESGSAGQAGDLSGDLSNGQALEPVIGADESVNSLGQAGNADIGQYQTGQFEAGRGDILASHQLGQGSGNFPGLAEKAIEIVIAKHAKPWKEQTLIDHTDAALLEASAYFRSIADWATIRSALVSTPLIGSVQVRSLSRNGAELLIRSFGDPQKLAIAMETQGVTLWSDDGEVWRVAMPDLVPEVRARTRGTRKGRRFGAHEGATADPTSQQNSSGDEGAAIIETNF